MPAGRPSGSPRVYPEIEEATECQVGAQSSAEKRHLLDLKGFYSGKQWITGVLVAPQ